MNVQLRADAKERPRAFSWYGPIARKEIEQWVERLNIVVPDELIDLWGWTGGLIFDSEDILRPVLGPEVEDSVQERNEWYREQGLAEQYVLFHEGLFFSAIRQLDGVIVELDRNTLREVRSFESLSDWYMQTLQQQFAWRYRLRLLGGEATPREVIIFLPRTSSTEDT